MTPTRLRLQTRVARANPADWVGIALALASCLAAAGCGGGGGGAAGIASPAGSGSPAGPGGSGPGDARGTSVPQPPSSGALGSGPGTVVAPLANGFLVAFPADVDLDGIPDLVTGDPVRHAAVRYGRGDGTFTAGIDLPAPAGTSRMLGGDAGDLDDDGRTDVVLFDGFRGCVVFHQLDSNAKTFEVLPSLDVGERQPVDLHLGDVDHDGTLDVVVACSFRSPGEGNAIVWFRGHGDGTFDPRRTVDLPAQPVRAVLGSFDADETPEIAVMLAFPAPATLVLVRPLAVAPTPLVTTVPVPGALRAWSLAAGDLDRDGALDLAIGDVDAGGFHLLYGRGDGTFDGGPLGGAVGPWFLPSPLVGTVLGIADIDGDDDLDLVALGDLLPTQSLVKVFVSDGVGGFAPSPAPAAALPAGLVVMDGFVLDATSDGIPDVVLVTFDGNVDTLVGAS